MGAELGFRRGFLSHPSGSPVAGESSEADVEPRDSGMTWLDVEEATRLGLDIFRPLVGWVRTSDDQRFESKPAPLMRR